MSLLFKTKWVQRTNKVLRSTATCKEPLVLIVFLYGSDWSWAQRIFPDFAFVSKCFQDYIELGSACVSYLMLSPRCLDSILATKGKCHMTPVRGWSSVACRLAPNCYSLKCTIQSRAVSGAWEAARRPLRNKQLVQNCNLSMEKCLCNLAQFQCTEVGTAM